MQHNLEFMNIFTDNGKFNSNGGKEYKGMKHFDAHVAVEMGFGAEGV
jgi:valyl-tRNA synthetase